MEGEGKVRQIITDGLGYWEPRRILYKLALSGIVIGYFVAGLPHSRSLLTFDFVLGLFLLAVLANVVYCAAYPVDIFAQLSGFQELWKRFRWILFLIGALFASVITRFIAMSMFAQ
jgi:hypothetical protein